MGLIVSGRPALMAIGFALLLGRGPAAAATAERDPAPPAFPLATNIQQLRQLAQQERRVICSFRIEGMVCATNTAKDQLILHDDSGAELFKLDLAGSHLSPGDRVKLDGQRCSVAIEGAGLAVGKSALVDNDGIHPMLRRSGKVYLAAGSHPVRLLWFNARGRYGLTVSFQGPGMQQQRIPDCALYRAQLDPATGITNRVNGVDYRCYEGPWVNLASVFGGSKLVKAGHAPNFDLGVRTRDEQVGLEFTGYVEVPREGLYTFDTESDDGSLLYVGESAPALERVGPGAPPAARKVVVAQTLPEHEEPQWVEVEGFVTFASETAGGLDLELRGETGRMEVEVADASGLPPTRLLHHRIRAAGVGRGIHSIEGPPVLGLLSVLGRAGIALEEPPPSAAPGLPLLTTGEEVKRLKRDEAQRGFPVRIRGVITRAVIGYDSVVIQDATRGVYVRGLPARNPGAPQLAEYWEIEGTTAPGDFAPVITWRQGRRLGVGRLPEPVTATWDRLINGSLDTQYVELQGVVTAVGTNHLELLLREGRIKLGFLDREPGTLNAFENARLRIRGCLFPSWNRATHRVNLGEMNISSASITVEEPAPRDLFAIPAKGIPELLLFDPGAGAFERVKVAGQFLGERQGQCFVTDGTNGLRFQPPSNPAPQPGDLVEVAGFPELGGPSPLLREAVARKTGHADLPPAQPLLPENWLDVEHDATRVRAEGLLVNQRREAAEQVLELQAGLRTFVARLGATAKPSPPLPLGSRVGLTGVYAAQGGNRALGRGVDSFELLLDSPADLQVLARPSWLTLPRVLVALGTVAFILLLAMLWALSLRRQVAHQTAIIHQKAQREAALEERARIAKDIHDDVGSNLTFIMMLGERSREDIAKPRDLAVHTDKIVSYARATVQALDEIVWAINPQNDTLDAMVGYLNQYASQFFESTNVRCRLDVPEHLSSLVLPAEVRHDLFLVVKEALNNVLKHAKASEVTVAVAESVGVLEIFIEDNGFGFDPAASVGKGQGDGLENMRKRMAKIGGGFHLTSLPGQGTKLRLTVNVNGELQV
jgi:signal transduction histidine kinase